MQGRDCLIELDDTWVIRFIDQEAPTSVSRGSSQNKIYFQEDQINILKQQVSDIQKLIKDASLIGLDIHRNSNSWGIICLAGDNTSFIKFFEISKNHTKLEIENIIRHIQPNTNKVYVDYIGERFFD